MKIQNVNEQKYQNLQLMAVRITRVSYTYLKCYHFHKKALTEGDNGIFRN